MISDDVAKDTDTRSALTAEQLGTFRDQGYLIVDNVIEPETYLDPLVADYEGRLDVLLSSLYAGGRISSTYQGLPFGRRICQLYAETSQSWAQYFDFALPIKGAIGSDEPCFFPASIFNILRSPGILDVVEALIGPEIYSNPVQHVRLKPPERLLANEAFRRQGMVGSTPWHQDAAVVLEEADETEIITVWLPVFDSTIENGCLRVAPRNHTSGLIEHCIAPAGRYLSTHLFDSDTAVPEPMKRGSVLFMSKMTPHSSLPNNSDEVRWSLDLRYQPTGKPTGRPEFPGFVARSRRSPDSELRDPVEWERRWLETRSRLAAKSDEITKFSRSWAGTGCP